MVDSRSIVEQINELPVMFDEILRQYQTVSDEDEEDFENILSHASSQVREIFSMLKTLQLFVRDPSEESRKDLQTVSYDLSETMSLLARYAILDEFRVI